jgi:hypothetical protein
VLLQQHPGVDLDAVQGKFAARGRRQERVPPERRSIGGPGGRDHARDHEHPSERE